jgi:hypothetical protein
MDVLANAEKQATTTPAAKPTTKSPAPHGDIVKQNGITYKWNGIDYEEVK